MFKKCPAYNTFLCVGTFTDENTATITNKTQIASQRIVEKHEWERGSVDLQEFIQFLKSGHDTYLNEKLESGGHTCCHSATSIGENIKLFQMDGVDLFLQEKVNKYLDCLVKIKTETETETENQLEDHKEPKYILVQKNYSYKIL